jgi:hypothetical protein
MTSSIPPLSAEDSAQPMYISPVLRLLEAKSRPQPSPACETCPASLWFSPKGQLKCFCTRMHVLTWDTTADEPPPPVMACDGREIALMALAEQMERAASEG